MKEFNKFNTDISSIIIPEKLNSPFYYTPCKLSQLASTQVQEELNKIPKSIHNFLGRARSRLLGRILQPGGTRSTGRGANHPKTSF